MEDLDYKKLGMKCGLEIHVQLSTKNKLFCSCLSRLVKEDNDRLLRIQRRLRTVAGELGEIDTAAIHESEKGKTFEYVSYPEESCLVELDEEIIHDVSPAALSAALQIARLLNCEIPDEIHFMRKLVIDGSNISGFQRTAIVGMNGFIDTDFGRVRIANVSLEEDSAQIVSRLGNKDVYGLDRLGMPLVEIGTEADIHSPEQARQAAEKIGGLLKLTGKVHSHLGAIRQDLNVSISGGARSEIKGVQSLSLIPKVIEEEVKRQLALVLAGKNVHKDVRRALPDGSTEFLRPLPGAARLYPETDHVPVAVTEEMLTEAKKTMKKATAEELSERCKISLELARQIINENKAVLFESLSENYDPSIVANILTSYLKEMKSEKIAVEKLTEERLKEFFSALNGRQPAKETMLRMLRELAMTALPAEKIASSIETLPDSDIRKIVEKIIKSNKDAIEKYNAANIIMGLVMKEVKGKAQGNKVMKIIQEEIKKTS
ncbi:MAG: Glu-tRNA(Gln) amidotransferase subunit GatE [Candidatus Aenigmarchaeota archaeon]|nr:Glu-tRNA(Gln) amidotransferase subunit GatE [Candidatus Aenigmarchaeota archaeon]